MAPSIYNYASCTIDDKNQENYFNTHFPGLTGLAGGPLEVFIYIFPREWHQPCYLALNALLPFNCPTRPGI